MLRYHPIKARFIRLSVFLFSWQRCSLATNRFSCKKEEWEHCFNIFIQFILISIKLIDTSVLNRLNSIQNIYSDFKIIFFLQNDSFMIYNNVSLRWKMEQQVYVSKTYLLYNYIALDWIFLQHLPPKPIFIHAYNHSFEWV